MSKKGSKHNPTHHIVKKGWAKYNPTHHIVKEGWALDVGRGLIPWVELGDWGLELVPAAVALGDLGITTFYLASIRPDAAILEQGDLVATTRSLTTSPPNTAQTGSASSDATLVPVITVVIAAVVAPLVVVLVIAYNNSVRKKALLTVPRQETVHPDASSRNNGCGQETVHPDASSRTNGCGQESRDNSKNSSTADLANSGDGCSNGIP